MAIAMILAAWIAIVLFGIEKKKIVGQPLEERQATALRGICAVEIMIGHIGLYTGNEILYPNRKAGVLFVGVFLLLSGYGVAYSVEHKKDYLQHFIRKKILKLILPAYLVYFLYEVFKVLFIQNVNWDILINMVLVRKWGDGKLKSRLWDIKFVTIKSSKRRMTFMDDDNRIKLADLISKLPQEAVDALYKAAASLLGTASNKDNPACPYCGGHHVVKNGHKCGKQEYLCRQCGKTFVSTTHTLMAHSHQPKQVWEAVLMDTLAGDAIDYSAKQLEVSHDCVFYMRHKILLGLHGLLEETGVCLGGVSELDETFVLDSYKGGSLPEDAARPARRHGAKAQKRGISDEYVCICTGVERKGDAIAGSINRAKPSSRELGKMFKGHIKEGTLVLCDGLKSYLALEKDTGCSVKDVTEERSGKFFNLNTVNNFHSFIKSRYKFYRGVATKYLNRYNDLFSIAYRQAREKAGQLCNQLLEVSSINRNYTNRDVKMRGLLDI